MAGMWMWPLRWKKKNNRMMKREIETYRISQVTNPRINNYFRGQSNETWTARSTWQKMISEAHSVHHSWDSKRSLTQLAIEKFPFTDWYRFLLNYIILWWHSIHMSAKLTNSVNNTPSAEAWRKKRSYKYLDNVLWRCFECFYLKIAS